MRREGTERVEDADGARLTVGTKEENEEEAEEDEEEEEEEEVEEEGG